MSDELARPGASASSPLLPAPVRRAAENIGEHIADELDNLGWYGLSDNARRNLLATGFSAVGCSGFLAVMLVLFLLRTAGLMGDDSPVIVAQSFAVTANDDVDPLALQPGEELYRVVANDALSVIAVKNGVTMEALVTRNAGILAEWEATCLKKAVVNPGACTDVVIKGKDLVIPASAEPATSAP